MKTRAYLNRVTLRILVAAIFFTGIVPRGHAQSSNNNTPDQDEPSKATTAWTLFWTGVVVVAAGVWVYKKVQNKKKEKIEKLEQEKKKAEEERLAKLNRLEGKTVKDIKVISDPAGLVAPAGAFNIGLVVTIDDGQEIKTPGFAEGKGNWEDYKVTVENGKFYDGKVTVLSDPRKLKGNKVKITASPASNPSVTHTLELPVTFKASYYSSYSGQGGQSGRDGERGREGNKGTENKKGNGGNGGDGGNGQPGGNGGNGGSGQAVDVYVTAFKQEGQTLLKVYSKSRNTGEEDFYIVDPKGGSFTVYARGGKGGGGGRGGDGGQGGRGGDGHSRNGNTDDTFYGVGGNGGRGGIGANGGDGGDGGDGGAITIYIDPSAAEFKEVIKYDNSGGDGGSPGSGGNQGSSGGAGYADTNGQGGASGSSGSFGNSGRSGRSGPKPSVNVQKVNIDWDKVAQTAGE